MNVVINNPAPETAEGADWGDTYFADALGAALRTRGCEVSQCFWPHWKAPASDQVVIVLRGLRRWIPDKTGFRILWVLSHPAQVDSEELAAYDLVLTASDFHTTLLRSTIHTPVELARQCTEAQRFVPPEASLEQQAEQRTGLLYVARSRGVRRDIAQWLLEAGIVAEVFGSGWESFGLGHLVAASHIPNQELPALYQQGRFGLNDHWLDMRAFGYINNRVFDCLASGLPVITDEFPEIQALFGAAILYASSGHDLAHAIDNSRYAYQEILGQTLELSHHVRREHSFDARAAQLVHWIEQPPRATRRTLSLPRWHAASADQARRVIHAQIAHEEKRVQYYEAQLREAGRRSEFLSQEKKASDDRSRRKDAKLKRQAERLTTQHNRLQQKEDELRREKRRVKVLRGDLMRATRAISAFESYAVRLEKHIAAKNASTSWRLTAPIRRVTSWIKSIRRGHVCDEAPAPVRPQQITDFLEKRRDSASCAVRVAPGKQRRKAKDQEPPILNAPVHRSDEQEVEYWHLQAKQLLEELSYVQQRLGYVRLDDGDASEIGIERINTG